MTSVETTETLVRSVGGLAVVLGLIWIAVRLLRSRVGAGGQSQLQVVQRVALSKKSAVTVVRVADRCLLLGVGEAGVTFLAEIPPDPLRPLEAAPPTDSVPNARADSAVPLQRGQPMGLRGVLSRAQDRTVRR